MSLHRFDNQKLPTLFTASSETLAVARAVVFGIWFIIIWTTDLSDLTHLPADQYKPVGLFKLLGSSLSGNLSTTILQSFQILLGIITGIAAAGIRPFAAVAVPAAIGIFVFDSLLKSYAPFINHAQLGILYAAIILSFSPASDALAAFKFKPAKIRPSETYQFPMTFTAFSLSLCYCFVGVRRLTMGPDVIWNDSLTGWIATRTLEPIGYGFTLGLEAITHPLLVILMKVGFGLTSAFELLSPWAVFNDKFRRVWLSVIIPFHFSTLFAMNIFFWENLLLIIVYFTGLSYKVIPNLLVDRRAKLS